MAIFFGTAQPLFPSGLAGNFNFGTALIHTPNLMHKLLLEPLAILISFPETVLGTTVERQIKFDI